MNKTRYTSAKSVIEPVGEQTQLSDTLECQTEHKQLKVRYNIDKCPYCGMILPNFQATLSTFEGL